MHQNEPVHLTDDPRLGREVIIPSIITQKEGVKGVLTRIDSYPSTGDEIWYVGPYSAHANFFQLVEQENTHDTH